MIDGIRTNIRRNDLLRMGQAATRKVRQVVKKVTADVGADAVASIQTGPKTGRVYGGEQEVSFFATGRRYDVKRVSFRASTPEHQASAPGEAPANEFGGLAGGIQDEMVEETVGAVTVAAEYGADLEFGTEDMDPRPFLGPAVEKQRAVFPRAVAAALDEGLRRGASGR